jgi:hypothetical protein
MTPNCWLPLFMGMTLAARADETPSEQEAFDRYFGMPAAARQSEWTTHFSIGAAVGFNISAKFNENGTFNLPSSSLANGIYDDGYVLPGKTAGTGYTWDWGYQNSKQYNAAAQTLTMDKTTSYTTPGNSSKDDGGPFPGFEMDYGGSLYHWQNFRIGWDLGFDLVPLTISDNQTLTATVNQNAYTFNVPNGIVVPGAGYQGSYNGPGPLLSTSSTSSLSTPTGTVSGTRSLDTILYGLRLGPTFYWDFANNWSASLGVGPAMGIVSAEYKYNEVVTTSTSSAQSNGSFHGLDVVYGGDVNATLFYHTADKKRPVDLYISAQFMPLGSADFSQGGRDAKLDLSGQIYISAGVNWPF